MSCERCGYVPKPERLVNGVWYASLDPDHDCAGRRIMQERVRIVDALRKAGTRENDQGLCTEGLALLKAAEAIIDIKEDP